MGLRIERPGAGSRTMERWVQANGENGVCRSCRHPPRRHWMVADTLRPDYDRIECSECQECQLAELRD